MQKRKLYNSSAAFALGNAVYTESSSGCLRALVISANGIRGDIAPEYKLVGAFHEDNYATELGDKILHRERSIQRQLSDTVVQSGRMDFELTNGEIHETKATYSESIRRSAIKNGDPKLNHVAQLVSYLINEKKSCGRLVYGYYEENPQGVLYCADRREIVVEINDSGDILIDGAIYEWSVLDQVTHTTLAAKALEDITQIPERPINAGDGFASPCRFCDYREVCDRYDAGEVENFLGDAQAAIQNKIHTPVKIKRRKR